MLDEAALAEGWVPPDWYLRLKTESAPLLGATPEMARAARAAGLTAVQVDERPVDVGVTEAEQLVAYRLGQANFAPWVNALGPRRTTEVTGRLVERVRPVMTPYQPVVVWWSEGPRGDPITRGTCRSRHSDMDSWSTCLAVAVAVG